MSARSITVRPFVLAAKQSDNSGLADARLNFEAERAEPLRDERGGFVFLET